MPVVKFEAKGGVVSQGGTRAKLMGHGANMGMFRSESQNVTSKVLPPGGISWWKCLIRTCRCHARLGDAHLNLFVGVIAEPKSSLEKHKQDLGISEAAFLDNAHWSSFGWATTIEEKSEGGDENDPDMDDGYYGDPFYGYDSPPRKRARHEEGPGHEVSGGQVVPCHEGTFPGFQQGDWPVFQLDLTDPGCGVLSMWSARQQKLYTLRGLDPSLDWYVDISADCDAPSDIEVELLPVPPKQRELFFRPCLKA